MRQRKFGHTGIDFPVVGQGTWYLDNARDASRVLGRGIDLGLTHIDTAEMYGGGAAEKVVGKAIRGRRHEVQLVSKLLPSNATTDGTKKACERSLKRLGTDYLDIYLLHWPGQYAVEDTIAGFEKLLDEGKIRAYGVSNFDIDDLEELEAVSDAARIACNQVLYHPTDRTVENTVQPWCRRYDIPIVAYSPFGHDGLEHLPARYSDLLNEIAIRAHATTYQVALAFLTRAADVFAIPKAANTAHLEDNAKAGALELSADELLALEAVLPKKPSGTPLGMI